MNIEEAKKKIIKLIIKAKHFVLVCDMCRNVMHSIYIFERTFRKDLVLCQKCYLLKHKYRL